MSPFPKYKLQFQQSVKGMFFQHIKCHLKHIKNVFSEISKDTSPEYNRQFPQNLTGHALKIRFDDDDDGSSRIDK